MLNPFLIEKQRAGEDRLTYAFACALEACGPQAMLDLLSELRAALPFDIGGDTLRVDLQASGSQSRPDARFTVDDQLVVLFENKVKANTLSRDQLKRHMGLFGAAAPTAVKILLVITPDQAPPAWLDGVEGEDVQILFASWQFVGSWAFRKGLQAEYGDEGSALMSAMAQYGAHMGLVDLVDDRFLPGSWSLLAEHAHNVREATRQHEKAQEKFLERVHARLNSELEYRSLTDALIATRVRSRGTDNNCFVPVSSLIEGWCVKPALVGWKGPHVWGEVYLRRFNNRSEFWLRTGLLLENQAVVSAWFGKAQEAARTRFPHTYGRWNWKTSYAEVWSMRPFDFTAENRMEDAMVNDLVAWVAEVVPALSKM